jgi:hypothetical protein
LALEFVWLTLTGALFYNAPKVSSDQINVNGSGSLKLSPMTTGTWVGMTIFQARGSTNTLFVSGIGSVNVTGASYAAGPQ